MTLSSNRFTVSLDQPTAAGEALRRSEEARLCLGILEQAIHDLFDTPPTMYRVRRYRRYSPQEQERHGLVFRTDEHGRRQRNYQREQEHWRGLLGRYRDWEESRRSAQIFLLRPAGRAGWMWAGLGFDPEEMREGLRRRWLARPQPDPPTSEQIEQGETRKPLGLRQADAPDPRFLPNTFTYRPQAERSILTAAEKEERDNE